MNQLSFIKLCNFPVGFLIVLITISIPTLANSTEQNKSKKEITTRPAASSHSQTIIIPVEGMTCLSCVAGIKNALKSVEGVGQVEVDLKERNARVVYNEEKISPDIISRKISELGYKTGQWLPEVKK